MVVGEFLVAVNAAVDCQSYGGSMLVGFQLAHCQIKADSGATDVLPISVTAHIPVVHCYLSWPSCHRTLPSHSASIYIYRLYTYMHCQLTADYTDHLATEHCALKPMSSGRLAVI